MEDGLVDRYLNRKISARLTRWLVKTAMTPNQITLLSFLVGLVAVVFFWRGGYASGVAGAVVFQFSAILDCCDGEVARLKRMQSRLGQWLDLVCDNLVHVGLFMAIGWALYRQHAETVYWILGGMASAGSLLSLQAVLISMRRSRKDPAPSEGRERLIKSVTDRLTNRDFSAILFLFALLGRLDLFLWLAALGSNVFWMVLLWLYRKDAPFFPSKS